MSGYFGEEHQPLDYDMQEAEMIEERIRQRPHEIVADIRKLLGELETAIRRQAE